MDSRSLSALLQHPPPLHHILKQEIATDENEPSRQPGLLTKPPAPPIVRGMSYSGSAPSLSVLWSPWLSFPLPLASQTHLESLSL